MSARRLFAVLPLLAIAGSTGCSLSTNSTPKISDVKIISTTDDPPTISFTLEFLSGMDSVKVGEANPQTVFVGIGPPDSVGKMVDFLIERNLGGASLRGGPSVTSCSDPAWKRGSDARRSISGRVEFTGQERAATRVPVSFVLLDKAGARSNQIDLDADFSTGTPRK